MPPLALRYVLKLTLLTMKILCNISVTPLTSSTVSQATIFFAHLRSVQYLSGLPGNWCFSVNCFLQN